MTGLFFYIPGLKKLSINACTIENFWQSLQCHHDIPSKLPKNILSFYFQSFFCSLSVQATWFAGNKYLILPGSSTTIRYSPLKALMKQLYPSQALTPLSWFTPYLSDYHSIFLLPPINRKNFLNDIYITRV